jgi:hypothetical protein
VSDAAPRSQDLDRSLRRVRLAVLVTLGAAALASLLAAPSGSETVGRGATVGALGLGLASVLARRQAEILRDPRWRLALALAALLLAGGLGLLGAGLAVTKQERDVGLVYSLAGAILCLRRPPPVLPPGPGPVRP